MTPVRTDPTTAPAATPAAIRPPKAGGDAQLAAAGILLVAVAVAALYFMLRPGPSLLDHWALALVPARHRSHFLGTVTRLASLPVMAAGTAAGVLAVLRRDRPRRQGQRPGPVLAVAVAELVMKPAVGRKFEGVLCFPSGTVVAVAALATVAALAAPAAWGWSVTAVGAAGVALTALAVVALGWHYPSDALAGAATGTGTVLAADVAAHRLAARLRWTTGGDQPKATGAPPVAADR